MATGRRAGRGGLIAKMMPGLLEQRRLDVEKQFAMLPQELEEWRAASQPGEPYQRHHSQIAVLSAQMLELSGKIESEWRNGPQPDSFQSLSRARLRCAAIQTIWSFFREKLVLRVHPIYGPFLKAADAYAWACYEPVLKDARRKNPNQAYREPPLVVFHSEISPWALSRQSRYETERDPSGMAGTDENSAFERVRRALPIPILATPWHNLRFFPNLALLAHETGHIVESDFALEDIVKAAIEAALQDPVHREGWAVFWRKEVFADLFACFAAGPSFVWALVDSILESPAAVAAKVRPATMLDPDPAKRWGKYPPAALRVALNLRALREHGYGRDADRIKAYWEAAYPNDPMAAWAGDLAAVVKAVFGIGMPASFRLSSLAGPMQTAYLRAGLGRSFDPQQGIDPRAMVWAACVIHRGGDQLLGPPVAVPADKAWALLQAHIVESQPAGVLADQVERVKELVLRTDELSDLLFEDFDS